MGQNHGTSLSPPAVYCMVRSSSGSTLWHHPRPALVSCTSHQEGQPLKCIHVGAHGGGGDHAPPSPAEETRSQDEEPEPQEE